MSNMPAADALAPDEAPASSADPFFITGPAVISFSGGRTSAFMLFKILQSHGGVLPDDVVVCFANTGREMPATLRFVHECGARWGVDVIWLEYRRVAGKAAAARVGYNSASRDGEPLEAIVAARKMLPNPVMRFCTIEGKIKTAERWIKAELGWSSWLNVVGLRADEMGRVERLNSKPAPYHSIAPLASAGIEKQDVHRFWKSQPFDLELAGPWEGNCDGCFLKSRAALERMFRDHPERMTWWADMEAQRGATFRGDRESYGTMQDFMERQGMLPFDVDEAVIPCDEAGCGI